MTAFLNRRILPRHLHGIRAGKPPLAQEDVHTQVAKASGGIVRLICARRRRMRSMRDGKVHPGPRRHVHTECAGIPDVRPGPGGTEKSLGGDAADVQTIPAHEVSLDQGDLCPQTGGTGGGDEARGPRADDHEIVAGDRFRVHPVARVDVPDQGLVVFVPGLHNDGAFGAVPSLGHGVPFPDQSATRRLSAARARRVT